MINSYVAVDLETTGLRAKEDKIIEIGAIKVVDGVQVDEFSTFVNPRTKISPRITELTGITNEDVKDAPFDTEAMADFLSFSEGFVLLGHNVRFDYSFLQVCATNNRFEFDKECIDTLKIARKALPEMPSRSLDCLTQHFDLLHEEKHRALSDALAASLLYQKFVAEYYEGNEKSFEPVRFEMKFKRESAISPKQIKFLSDLCKRYNIELDCEIESLTKNAASRMIDRIRVEYGR